MSFTSAPLPKPCKNMIQLQALSKELPASNSSSIKLENVEQYEQKKAQNLNDAKANIQNIKTKSHPKGNILHISNISPKLTYEQIKKGLYNLFSVHGPIYEIIIKTKQTGQHFAFVDFPDIRDAEKALIASKTQGKKLQNRPLMVNYCEDPKKNEARKDQKCFLCHNMGHKAIKCPVKPEMIKRKQKKIDDGIEDDDTNYIQIPTKAMKKIEPVEEAQQKQSSSSSEEQQQQPKQRDRDYLRFLKLKRKLLQKKLKKIKKPKKRKN